MGLCLDTITEHFAFVVTHHDHRAAMLKSIFCEVVHV